MIDSRLCNFSREDTYDNTLPFSAEIGFSKIQGICSV